MESKKFLKLFNFKLLLLAAYHYMCGGSAFLCLLSFTFIPKYLEYTPYFTVFAWILYGWLKSSKKEDYLYLSFFKFICYYDLFKFRICVESTAIWFLIPTCVVRTAQVTYLNVDEAAFLLVTLSLFVFKKRNFFVLSSSSRFIVDFTIFITNNTVLGYLPKFYLFYCIRKTNYFYGRYFRYVITLNNSVFYSSKVLLVGKIIGFLGFYFLAKELLKGL